MLVLVHIVSYFKIFIGKSGNKTENASKTAVFCCIDILHMIGLVYILILQRFVYSRSYIVCR